MAEFLSPGVFIQEKQSGQFAAQGVSTSTFATLGWLKRGPTDKATLVGSYAEFTRIFGTPWKQSDVPLAMEGFFKNGGARAYVTRVVPEDATKAVASIPGYNAEAISAGTWGNLLRLRVQGNVNAFDTATATYSAFDVLVEEETVDGKADYAVSETFSNVNLSDPDSSNYIMSVVNDVNSGSSLLRLAEVSGGIPADFIPTTVTAEALGTGAGGVSGTYSGTLASFPIAPFSVEILVAGVVKAKDNGRGKLVAVSGSGYTSITGTVNYATGVFSAVLIADAPSGEAVTANYINKGVDALAVELTGAVEGTSVGRAERTAAELQAGNRGLYSFDLVEEVLQFGFPDITNSLSEKLDLIAYAQNRANSIAIIDVPFGFDPQDAKNYRDITLASLSSYGAIYYPNLVVADPLKDGRRKVVSCVGHVAGIYARTDNNRNVAKAPAGINDGQLQGVLDVERVLSKTDRDLIYPVGINPIVSGPAFGRAVYGARTLQKLGDFQLVPHRRLFNFLKQTFFVNTQDLVFEPITEDLYAIAKARFEGFLSARAGEGYFISTNPDEAFRVVVDSSNNTNQTIAERKLIIDVLIAVSSPAEFVIERFERTLAPIG
jgi:hypothetical protein